jgi:hypothetical protein
MSLNVMVLESERGAADEAVRELTGAGHVVLRCHDSAAPVFPCRGIVDESTCPLRSHVVDMALIVRSRVRSEPTSAEDGAKCALMTHVPLVVAGPSGLDPYQGLETRVLDRTFGVVATCEEAAAAEFAVHTRRAEAVIADMLGVGRASVSAVSVTRRAGGLLVRVAGLERRTARERQAAVVRVTAALRGLDRGTRAIDVVLDDSPA